MSNLDKINFKKYLSSENNLNVCLVNPFNNEDNTCEINSFTDDSETSCEFLESDLEINKRVALDNELKKFESVSINNIVYKMEKISDTYSKLTNTLNYQIHHIKNSDKIDMSFEGLENKNTTNFIMEQLDYLEKMLNLEFNKNELLRDKALEYLNLENINFYLIPKIEISYTNDIFEVKIRESNIFYRFKIIAKNVGVGEVILKLNEIIDYFNSRYNLLSGIINHLRLRQKNYCIK